MPHGARGWETRRVNVNSLFLRSYSCVMLPNSLLWADDVWVYPAPARVTQSRAFTWLSRRLPCLAVSLTRCCDVGAPWVLWDAWIAGDNPVTRGILYNRGK